MSLKYSLALLIILLALSAKGQLIVSDTLILKETLTSISQDRTGNIFIAFSEGRISKYSSNLDLLNSYSPTKVGDINLLEAWHGFQIFSYFKEFQEFMLLDRFLTRDTRYDLGESGVSFIDLATISSDQNLWLIEENRLQLLKYNLKMRELEITVPLESILGSDNHNFLFMREYQNLLFLVDENSGIYVFDNLGNYLRKIQGTGMRYCSFYQDILVYTTENTLFLVGLYSDMIKQYPLPSTDVLGALMNQSGLLLFKEDRVLKMPIPE